MANVDDALSPRSLGIFSAWVLFLLLGGGLAVMSLPPVEAQDLPAPVYEIHGRVVDFKGQPRAEAKVVLAKSGAASSAANASTDAEGKYTFSLLEPGDYALSATHACCTRASESIHVGGLDIQNEAPDLMLGEKQPPASGKGVLLRGVAKDKDSGKTVSEARIDIENYYGQSSSNASSSCPDEASCVQPVSQTYQYFSAVTGADGSYEVEINPGTVALTVYHPEFDSAHARREVSGNTTLDIPMRKAAADSVRFHGILRGSDGGAIGGGYVSVGPDYSNSRNCDPCAEPTYMTTDGDWWYESHQNSYNSTTTQPDGSWELRVSAGKRLVSAYADGYLNNQVSLEAGPNEDRQVDLVLEKIPPDSVRVHGRVVDLKTGDALPYASLQLENQRWGHYNWTQARPDGSFEFWTKPGFTIVTASASRVNVGACAVALGDSSGAKYMRGMSISAPEPACESRLDHDYFPRMASFLETENGPQKVPFALVRRPDATSAFKGYVVDAATQKGIGGATVTFYNELTRDWGSATTDADGSYRIEVHAGYYTVRAWAEHHFDAVANAEIDEKETKRLDLNAEPGEKRYGYGGVYMTEDSAYVGGTSGDPAAAPTAAPGPAYPHQGVQVYQGEGGGLGPYRAQGFGSNANAPAPMGALTFAVALAVALLRRRGAA